VGDPSNEPKFNIRRDWIHAADGIFFQPVALSTTVTVAASVSKTANRVIRNMIGLGTRSASRELVRSSLV
jgi:hypothetical protein